MWDLHNRELSSYKNLMFADLQEDAIAAKQCRDATEQNCSLCSSQSQVCAKTILAISSP